ncbi:MAG: SRPBCC family protein [Deltaproteobacteria bacterium]
MRKSIVISAPPDRVFDYVTEPSTMAEWLTKMVEVRDIVGTGEGQQYEWTYKYAGLLLRGQSVVVQHVPNRLAVTQSIGMIGSTWTFRVEPHEEGSTLTIEVEYSIPIPVLGRVAEHVAVRLDARDLETSLTNVQDMLVS